MDYDDTDFRGQNLHLAGEGSDKVSSVLRPYALPKFDFDDGLQEHLRFDNLVENEVFLAIPNQEDNKWLEDFPRGSSGIEFSSSAAEPCSISRCTNVWSEATSSESVEMLLKSVGQEEIIPGETTIEASDVCNELGTISEHMESHMQQEYTVLDVMGSEPTLQVEDGNKNEQPQGAEKKIAGTSCVLRPNVSSNFCGTYAFEDNQEISKECDGGNKTELGTMDNESMGKTLQNDTFSSVMPIDAVDSCNQHTAMSIHRTESVLEPNASTEASIIPVTVNNSGSDGKCDHELIVSETETHDSVMEESYGISMKKIDSLDSYLEKIVKQKCEQARDVSAETEYCLLIDRDVGNAAGVDQLKEVHANDGISKGITLGPGTPNLDNHNSVPSEEKKSMEHTIATGIRSFEEPPSLLVKDDGNLQGSEHSHDAITHDYYKSSKIDPLALSNNVDVHQQFTGDVSEDLATIVQGDSNLQEHHTEVENLNTGVSASSELKMDHTADEEDSSAEGRCLMNGSDQLLDGEAASSSVVPELSNVDNKVFDDNDGNSGCGVGNNFSSTLICSSTEMHEKIHPIVNSDSINGASGNVKVDSDVVDRACSPSDAGSKETPKADNGKTAEPYSQGDLMEVGNVVFSGSESDTSVSRKQRGDTTIGPLDNAPGANENVPDQLLRVKNSGDKGWSENILLSSKALLEKEGEAGASEEIGEGLSHPSAQELSERSVKELPKVDTSIPASGADQAGASPEKSAVVLDTETCQETPEEQTVGTPSLKDHAVATNEVGIKSSHELEVSPAPCNPKLRQDGNEELVLQSNVGDLNIEEAVSADNHELASSKVADSAQPAEPAAISCTLLPESDKDKNEVVGESLSKGMPVPEITMQLIGPNSKENDAAKDESRLTLDVQSPACPSGRGISKDGPSSLSIQSCKVHGIAASPSTPGVAQVDIKTVPQISQGTYDTPDVKIEPGGPRKSTERKARRPSGKTTGKGNTKRGDAVKETISQGQSGGKMCLSGTSNLVHFEEFKPHGNSEHSGPVPSVLSATSSKLSVLSKSSPSSSLFQQQFTDSQQVQLRAQIFVYGSLIQGAAPDEACMVSAFGASDGGRVVWERIWRSCLERVQGRKSQAAVSEYSVQPCSVNKSSGQSTKKNAVQGNLLTTPSGRVSGKGTPSPVVKSMIPLSSPLWNMSTPPASVQTNGVPRSNLIDYRQTVSPLHPFQSTPAQKVAEHNSSWLSQVPFPGHWLASPQTTPLNDGAHFSILPMTEAVKLTPVKEPVTVSSGTKQDSSNMVAHSPCSIVFGGSSSIPTMKQVSVPSAQNSPDPKSRHRKKVTGPANFGQISVVPQPQTESLSVPVGTSHVSASMVVSIPAIESSSITSKVVTAVTPSMAGLPKSGEQNIEKALSSVDTFSQVQESRRQAEDAAALAAAAVIHSQSVWSQLDQQKSSGLLSDTEAKLASTAVIVAAAASVAKAAAAAAKIASDAAQQAKLMADEALICSTSNLDQSTAASLSDVVNRLGKATSASILKGGDGNNSSTSIILAAREAARRKVEAASAASKHAENLDAIVKAAELAAEAVSQAGKIVSMGQPFPLDDLVKAGPEGFWRTQQVSTERVAAASDLNIDQSKSVVAGDPGTSGKHAKVGPSEEEAVKTNSGVLPLTAEPLESMKEFGISGTIAGSDRQERIARASDMAKTIGAVAESEIGLESPTVAPTDEYGTTGNLKENYIKEGSAVEVRKDNVLGAAAWFTASVLDLKDGKVLVGYTDLQSEGDSGRLEEWVTLVHEGDTAPHIRIARPMTIKPFEGTKKRRRSAMGDYAWSIGDRVEAWMQNCWREGVISEKREDNTVTLKFSEEGEKSVVGAWHLRQALIWKDGEWIEWSSSRKDGSHSLGDTPQEKRLRLNPATMEGKSKENISKNVPVADAQKPHESRLLALSTNEKKFDIGRNSSDENKLDAHRTMRSGLQKEGSKVIFGVPKPGKKRKYMDVSKHYVADKSDNGNEPMKFAKYLMPQGPSSRPWKNLKGDSKDKQLAEPRTKVLKTGKQPSIPGRTPLQKEKPSSSELSSQEGIVGDGSEPVQQNQVEFGPSSNTIGATTGPILFSSRRLPSDAPTRKIPSSVPKSERSNRVKPAFSTGKFARVEVKDKHNKVNPAKSIPEVAEPRRSNRKIQPTSRLLEGLQSSLSISKMPSLSHEKGHRSLNNRGTPKGNNNG